MLISLAMTMTSPVELAGKTGWFDSLRRNRRNKSVGSTETIESKTITGAKSMSSLHTMTVVCHSTSTIKTSTVSRLDNGTTSSSSSTNVASKPPMSSWRSILSRPKKFNNSNSLSSLSSLSSADSGVSEVYHRNGNSSSPHPALLQVPLPVVKEQVDDKNLSSPFCTLPRKRGQQTQDGGRSLPPPAGPSTSSRSRSYSITSLDRRKKRSTVWYTHSESDILNGNRRVSLFLQADSFEYPDRLLFLIFFRFVFIDQDRRDCV